MPQYILQMGYFNQQCNSIVREKVLGIFNFENDSTEEEREDYFMDRVLSLPDKFPEYWRVILDEIIFQMGVIKPPESATLFHERLKRLYPDIETDIQESGMDSAEDLSEGERRKLLDIMIDIMKNDHQEHQFEIVKAREASPKFPFLRLISLEGVPEFPEPIREI